MSDDIAETPDKKDGPIPESPKAEISSRRENPMEMQLPLGDHLEELRARIICALYAVLGALAICLLDQRFYMDLVLAPHTQAMVALGLSPTIQVLQYEESFFCHLKVSLIAALILSMPFVLYQAWLFVSIGLYEQEKKYFKLFFPFAILFFALGVLFGYLVLIPTALRFLGGYGGSHIQAGFTLSSYISLFFVLTFVAGLIFELPLLMLFLDKINIFTTRDYLDKWRHFILGAFVVAAFLTPPDAVTQLLMAGPMIFLYFFGLLLCRVSERLHIIRRFLEREDLPS